MTQRRKYSIWLIVYPCFMLTLFFAVMITTVVYMAKCNEYQNTLSYYLNISRALHNRLLFLPIKKSNLLRLVNLFALSFIGCMYLFALRFYQDSLPQQRLQHSRWALWPIALLGLELILYDPGLYYRLYTGGFGFLPDPRTFRHTADVLHQITGILHWLFLAGGFVLILLSVFRFNSGKRIKPLRKHISLQLTIALCYAFLALLYESLFFDLPFPSLWISRLAGNYVQYRAPQLGAMSTYISLSPLIALLILVWLLVLLILNERASQSRITILNRFQGATQSAELSSRIFSHYIKNQIVAIGAEISQLYDMPKDYTQHLDNVTAYLEDIKNRINQLAQRMKGIDLQRSPCNLTSLLVYTIEDARRRATGIQFDFKTAENAEIVFCDAAMMQEVFTNLLTNAMEALRDTKRADKRIVVRLDQRYGSVFVTISDNGPGIQGDPEQLFTPFYTSKKTSSNWGVGLSFCRRIVELHGGVIIARNRLHGGAKFEIELPLVQDE